VVKKVSMLRFTGKGIEKRLQGTIGIIGIENTLEGYMTKWLNEIKTSAKCVAMISKSLFTTLIEILQTMFWKILKHCAESVIVRSITKFLKKELVKSMGAIKNSMHLDFVRTTTVGTGERLERLCSLMFHG